MAVLPLTSTVMLDHTLLETWETCKIPNWDGYDALPVQEATLQNARAFVQALPADALPNSVGAEPDGHLSLEWYQHPRWTLSVSISPEGVLYYAALLGNRDPRGSDPFSGEIPQRLLSLIREVTHAQNCDICP